MMRELNQSEIKEALEALPGWSDEGDEGRFLGKVFVLNDFSEAIAFMVRIGLEAEKASHHPDMRNVYNRVEIRLSTHDAGDRITQKDIDLAHAVERVSGQSES